jgi:hypothetical protein
VNTSASEVKFGENVSFSYSTSQPGYASVLYVGSDMKDIQSLLINKPVIATPKGSLGTTTISEPAGKNTFLILFSQVPLDLDSVLRDGMVGISSQSLQDIQCATAAGKSRNAAKFLTDDPCAGKTRNASKLLEAEPMGAVSGYSARVVTVSGR